jgi:predicted methyltransferase
MLRNVTHGLMVAVMLAATMTAYPETVSAQTQRNCASRDAVVRFLNTVHNEHLSAVGLVNPQTVVEIYVSEQGTWTIVVTTAAAASGCRARAGRTSRSRRPRQTISRTMPLPAGEGHYARFIKGKRSLSSRCTES